MPKLAAPLTDPVCKAGRRPSDRRKETPKSGRKLMDGGGLYLHVMPNGSKVWRQKFRLRGVEGVATLGEYPAHSLKAAREWREANAALLAKDINPVIHTRVEKRKAETAATNTFRAVAESWILRQRHWSKERGDAVYTSLENDPFRHFGDRPIHEITRADVLACVEEIDNRKRKFRGEEVGSHVMARRVLARISAVFDHALARMLVTDNPAAGLVRALGAAPKRGHPFVPIAELGDLLRKMREWGGYPTTNAAMQVVKYTFARPGEVRLARWEEFHLNGKEPTWIIPADRTKLRREQLVPLAPQVVAILKELHEVTKKRPYVFESALKPTKPVSEVTINKALADMGYRNRQVAHGFRKIASTILNEAGFNRDWIERQLAHVPGDVRGVYNRAEYLDDRRRMMAWYADHLDAIEADTEKKRPSNVVPMAPRVRRRA
ncbi:MAG TPA: tyrosine-type recombinase/integrase [Burkholderiaceae bacterium]|nr:tyrosine-type recombinase/integrase [Burkholderiaceae bacterium]HQR70445.1 tyrosine-type recombinase/integrase [Burkholderiaceae bacterium]